MKIRLSSIAFILFCSLGSNAHAQTAEELLFGNAKAKALLHDGNVLWSQQKINDAFEKFRLAGEADPKASGPWSNAAALYYFASNHTDAKYVEEYREMARSYAIKALKLNDADPLAQETLRELTAPSSNKPLEFSSIAINLFNEGENFFQRSDFRAALGKYEQAFAQAPNFAKAVLYAGDCYFQLGEFKEAEIRYNKALDLDPQNYQAWRFLAHAHLKLGHPPEVIKFSLLKAIEIQPNYFPAWDWYAALSEEDGMKLRPLNTRRLANVTVTKNGAEKSYAVEFDPTIANNQSDSDSATWTHYGIVKALLLNSESLPLADQVRFNTEPNMSMFKRELLTWKEVFNAERRNVTLQNPLLSLLRQSVIDGEIEAAIFIFFFDETFRPDFEEWKKTHPMGIRNFVEKYRLRPSPAV